jgi:predicted Rossmann fold flavoprotein
LGLFTRFQPRDTMDWFESRGVKLKTEQDGRVFPVTDSSQTIVDCLIGGALQTGVTLVPNCAVESSIPRPGGGFELGLANGKKVICDKLLLATGGSRGNSNSHLAALMGHAFEPPVPSLFSFHVADTWLRKLAGVALESVEVRVHGTELRERGALLITHEGLSGPAILRLSAWGARKLSAFDYKFPLRVNWLPGFNREALEAELGRRRATQPARLVVNSPLSPLTARLWEHLALAAGIPRDTRWAALSHSARHRFIEQLATCELRVVGKSLNKEEFVTCGGVRLEEVNFKTMESRLHPRLHFAGELLDIDGLTGGFNFQAAWTTGHIAGVSMAVHPGN